MFKSLSTAVQTAIISATVLCSAVGTVELAGAIGGHTPYGLNYAVVASRFARFKAKYPNFDAFIKTYANIKQGDITINEVSGEFLVPCRSLCDESGDVIDQDNGTARVRKDVLIKNIRLIKFAAAVDEFVYNRGRGHLLLFLPKKNNIFDVHDGRQKDVGYEYICKYYKPGDRVPEDFCHKCFLDGKTIPLKSPLISKDDLFLEFDSTAAATDQGVLLKDWEVVDYFLNTKTQQGTPVRDFTRVVNSGGSIVKTGEFVCLMAAWGFRPLSNDYGVEFINCIPDDTE